MCHGLYARQLRSSRISNECPRSALSRDRREPETARPAATWRPPIAAPGATLPAVQSFGPQQMRTGSAAVAAPVRTAASEWRQVELQVAASRAGLWAHRSLLLLAREFEFDSKRLEGRLVAAASCCRRYAADSSNFVQRQTAPNSRRQHFSQVGV